MKLLDINDTITNQKALVLCRHFGLDYLVGRIEANPQKYQAGPDYQRMATILY